MAGRTRFTRGAKPLSSRVCPCNDVDKQQIGMGARLYVSQRFLGAGEAVDVAAHIMQQAAGDVTYLGLPPAVWLTRAGSSNRGAPCRYANAARTALQNVAV